MHEIAICILFLRLCEKTVANATWTLTNALFRELTLKSRREVHDDRQDVLRLLGKLIAQNGHNLYVLLISTEHDLGSLWKVSQTY